MKILFISNVICDPNSGAAGTDYQTVLALRNLGHQVDAIWHDDLDLRISHPMLCNLLELPSSLRAVIRKRCAVENYDVIHVNQPYAYLAAKDHQCLGRPGFFVIRSHGFEARANRVLGAWTKKLRLKKKKGLKTLLGYALDVAVLRACRLAACYADGFVVSSVSDASFLIEQYHLRKSRVKCVAQAAPQSFLDASVCSYSKTRWRKLLFVGPPQLWKGLPFMIEAVSYVLADFPDTTFTWVAGDRDHCHIRNLFPQALRAQIILEPQRSQDELRTIYDECGIFLFPSLFEGFGKAPLEAASRGVVTVASNTGGMADFICSGQSGLLVKLGDSVSFRKAIVSVLRDYELAEFLSKGGREMAKQYTWSAMAKELSIFFKNFNQRD